MKEGIEHIINTLAERRGLFIENLKISLFSRHVDITIDGLEPISVKTCSEFCRAVQDELEKKGENFSVTVSSAGAFEPFRRIHQFKKNVGRDIFARLTNGQTLSGTLLEAGETGFVLRQTERVPKEKGKGKIQKTTLQEIPYHLTEYAQVKTKF